MRTLFWMFAAIVSIVVSVAGLLWLTGWLVEMFTHWILNRRFTL